MVSESHYQCAPPPNRGLIRAVYETIDGLGGGGEAQIRKYLPASITNSNQVATKKKVHQALSNGVGRGYFMRDGDTYRIAPISYYKARRDIIRSYSKSKGRKVREKEPVFMRDFVSRTQGAQDTTQHPPVVLPFPPKPTPKPQRLEAFTMKWLFVAGITGAAWGFSIGLLAGKLL